MIRRLLFCFVCLWFLTAAKIYKWTDEHGNVHFGNAPPPEAAQKAEVKNLAKDKANATELDQVIMGDWYAKHNGNTIKLNISGKAQLGWGYSWRESGPNHKRHLGGYLQPEGIKLKRVDNHNNVEGELLVRNQTTTSLELVDQETDVVYNFRKSGEARANLTEKEEAIYGQWAEVDTRRQEVPLHFISFDQGLFSWYRASRGDRITSTPNPNYKLASGEWHVDDDLLILSYIEGTKEFEKDALQTVTWRILKSNYRELYLERQGTQEKLYFRRERQE